MQILARLAVLALCAWDVHAQQWMPFTIPNGFSFVVGAGESPALLATQFVPDAAVRSTDGGRTWNPIDVGGQRPVAFIAAPTDGNVFYAIVGSTALAVEPQSRSLYRSNDAGKTWQLMTPRMQTPEGAVIDALSVGAQPDLLYGSRMGRGYCFTGSCNFLGSEGYISNDGGRTWHRREPSTGTGAYEAVPSASDANVAYGANYKGLFRTDDQGNTWRLVLEPPGDAFVYERQILVDRFDPSIVYGRFGTGPEIWITEDGGRNWRTTRLDMPEGWQWLIADPLEAGRVYAVGASGTIVESRDKGRSWQRVAESAGTAATNVNYTRPMLALENGRRVVYSATGKGPQRVVLFDPGVVASDLWWNAQQSGWGLSLTRHASGQLFGVWFTYDANGDPTWRVMPGGTWTDSRTFSATVYTTRGPAFFSGPAFDPSRVSVTAIGEATLVFDDASNAVFRYRLEDGAADEARISRQLFGPPAPTGPINYADLWWNPLSSGWGLAVSQQYANAFAVLFVYGEDGKPTWVVMPDAVYGKKDVGGLLMDGFHGDLFTTRGPPSTGPYEASRVIAAQVGFATLRFDNATYASGALIYDAFGRHRTEPLARQPF